ncbi:MAG: tyrosine-type recombinase/integrase [Campylobacterota bacterium]
MERLYRSKEEFLQYLDAMRGYSALTIRSYDDALDEMLEYAEIGFGSDSLTINLMPLRVRIAPLKPKTISAKLSAVRSFVKYLRSRGFSVEMSGDESVRVPKTLPKPVAHEHIHSAIEDAEPAAGLAILLLYSMGLRISELCGLKIGDVTPQWCRVRGKGAKERDIPVPAAAWEALERYRVSFAPKEYVFEAEGRKLSENSLRYMITKRFAEIGIKVTPHQLRHAYATELLNNGARIADVSELLGHASMATTQIYTKLGNALKMDHYLKSHPLCQHREDSE